MRHKPFYIVLLWGVPSALFGAVSVWYLRRHTVPVLQPSGSIGHQERTLLFVGLLLSAVVVVPVYIMTIAIVMRYREENHARKRVIYAPEWNHSALLESIWWGVPVMIIAVLSVVTWISSHNLDPYKPLASNIKPLNIQVVALNWKWLFIYPDLGVASVNLADVPANVPLNFTLTSDTVMNSFWVPQLGGQIYAMPGMSTQLHLMADKTGNYYGSPANIAGAGFAHMTFAVRAESSVHFNQWVQEAQRNGQPLNLSTYERLAHPSQDNPVSVYAHVTPGLYNWLVMQYMSPVTPGTPS